MDEATKLLKLKRTALYLWRGRAAARGVEWEAIAKNGNSKLELKHEDFQRVKRTRGAREFAKFGKFKPVREI